MMGKGAIAAKDRWLTMAPWERRSSGKNARVMFSGPSKLTAVLLDRVGREQIVVKRDARVIDEDVERADLFGGPLDLRTIRHVQR